MISTRATFPHLHAFQSQSGTIRNFTSGESKYTKSPHQKPTTLEGSPHNFSPPTIIDQAEHLIAILHELPNRVVLVPSGRFRLPLLRVNIHRLQKGEDYQAPVGRGRVGLMHSRVERQVAVAADDYVVG